ncbi:uncharacterized protein EV420DRAFT_1710288 [Desarmillaria tabescens]|uniref:F-box domain-containing protein n=1 Tax=Armillaria tabescens TaxID=1929756 RepID=A0AA39TTU6_ARMTA|nr:uncharacterized protein EV420DRAFT_1710288 [Desarmillaria tabescens]KAK0466258.1 hypothetical protein EV420DRAFT_1710288 [Desarmillaria tabescens]
MGMGFAFLPTLNIFTGAQQRVLEHDISFDIALAQSSRSSRTTPAPYMSRPPKSRMPLEIVMTIMEMAFYDETFDIDYSLLKACSLVCREWSAAAQRLLFHNVTLRTQSACLSFQSAVDPITEQGRMLGEAVVRMRVILDHNQPFGIAEQSFAQAVVLCPNLFELNLALYGSVSPGKDIIGSPDSLRMRRPAPSFDESTLSLLRCGPSISALQFSNWSENSHSISQLLSVWPSLKSLALSGNAPELPSDTLSPFPYFMDWLLHHSVGSLRVLGIAQEPSMQLLEYFVDTYGNTLESVSLPVCWQDTARSLHRCPHLRQISVERPLVSPLLFKKVSERLEHIAFGLNKMTALQSVIETVKTQKSLKAVTVHLWGGEQHPLFPSLQMACAYRGLELRITPDIRVFRTWMRGDPIEQQTYPRGKTLSNLYAMRAQSSLHASGPHVSFH